MPEISLTEQIIRKFYENFSSEKIAIIHSKIRKEEKLYYWHKIINNEIDIIIGARSAIFAPANNLGLIIVDEESDPSYKSGATPRYNARQVAFVRARNEKSLLVMGTATPSIETYYFAQKGKFKLFTLKERYNKQPLPEFNLIDLKEEPSFSKKFPLSEKLINEINNVLNKNEQVILFLNRRGFANYILCRNCGYVFTCPQCSISLTYHRVGNRLVCHYCGYTKGLKEQCEKCGSIDLTHGGAGTQKIQSLIEKIFSKYKVSRLDTDAVRKKGELSEIITKFESGDINLLTGTQMLSKGLNFPYVTFVGILFIDELLNLPDFRAAENTFTLIVQVSGRAGRENLPGKVFIQTFIPEHYAIKYASEYNFDGFYQYELKLRKQLYYPPFCRLIKITFEGKNIESVKKVSNRIAQYLNKELKQIEKTQILGPIPAPLAKIKGKFRYQILVKTYAIKNVKEYLTKIPVQERNVHIIIDVDPCSLL